MKKSGWKAGLTLLAACALNVTVAETQPRAELDGVVVTEEGIPGGLVVTALEIQAKVVAIDYEAREAGLLMPGGVVETVKVGPEAINFDQIKKGDLVDVVVTEELLVRMGTAADGLADGEEVVVMAAAPGEKPGVIAADLV